MKVSIITFHNWFNYGSALQSFATQEKFKEFCDDVELIDYIMPEHFMSKLVKRRFESSFVKGCIFLISALRMYYVFRKFKKMYLKTTSKLYTKIDDFNDFPLHDGLYCTGSDQVWNTEHNNGVDLPLYLSFVQSGKRKFAYAASIGMNKIPHEDIIKSKPFIDQYEKITVREESAVRVLNEQYEYKNVTQIVDPTLAMPPAFWRKFSSNSKIKKKYILMYLLSNTKGIDKYAYDLSQKTGYSVIGFCTAFEQMRNFGKSVVLPDIFDFITLIDNAEYLLTDSFHGTAFAMNLNTHPLVVYPAKYSSRLSSFLALINSEQCVVKNFDDIDVLNRPVDFDHVNRVLDGERERVNKFLMGIFHAEERNI